MLDFFTILTKGGLVLFWYQDAIMKQTSDVIDRINKLIHEAMLEGKNSWSDTTTKLDYNLDNEFNLIFVVGYNKMLKISYANKMLDSVQGKFRDRFRNSLTKANYHRLFNVDERKSIHGEFKDDFQGEYDSHRGQKQTQQMKSYKDSAKSQKTIAALMKKPKNQSNVQNVSKHVVHSAGVSTDSSDEETQSSDEADDDSEGNVVQNETAQDAERDAMADLTVEERRAAFMAKQKNKNIVNKKGGQKQYNKKIAAGKAKTEWGLDNSPLTGKKAKKSKKDFADTLDYSQKAPELANKSGNTVSKPMHADDKDLKVGKHSKIGALLANPKSDNKPTSENSAAGGMFSMFSNLTSKTLTQKEIQPLLEKMKEHLISKNVATDIAEKLCKSCEINLEGSSYSTFAGIQKTVNEAVETTLTKILTPKRRVDILRDVVYAKSQKRPYIITFCGVNGVGKSTNLAKICFWLIENGYNVMIAAGDTFRAGAVEQLKTHVRRLNSLHPVAEGEKDKVALYDQGYGKDAADIAFHSIKEANRLNYDVVLVDTAGRMQDNSPLMIALAKLITVNKPDLVLFVGEALVGNEAVDQLEKFNQALADNSKHIKNAQTIDGIVLTKFDTIDDKVGAAISMTYTTGQPVVFVGTGQSYPDLRTLNIKTVVKTLLAA